MDENVENTENVENVENAENVENVEVAEKQIDPIEQFNAIKEQQRQLKRERAQLNQTVEAQLQERLNQLKNDPLTAMQQLGLSRDDIVNKLMNIEPEAAEETPEQAYQRELAELKAWKEQQTQQAQQQKEQEILNNFRNQIDTVLNSNPDEFELVMNSHGGKDLLWKAIEAHATEYGEIPDIGEVARQTELVLEEQAKKLLGLKKFAKKSEVVNTPSKETVTEQSNTSSKTLTNKMTSRVVPTVERVDSRQANVRSSITSFQKWDQDRVQRVLDKFKN